MSASNKDERIVCATLGTAGHIDHGKTSLIYQLTGINADRFKEEQVRGMTIDLGYAFYETKNGKRVGVIDVPGHEKFVKNMVTGAASIDIVILTVAADDGVMPQTREHLEIMTVLGVKQGIIALTKIDLVDQDMIELATEDVKDLVKGTFLENSPILPLSSQTGEGMETFQEVLEEKIDQVHTEEPEGLFRMPVQRVFSAKGFGTVVTGVPVSGKVNVGDAVEVFPPGAMGKARGLQAFGQSFDQGKAGHRVAINISDVNYKQIDRGCVVCTPDYFEPKSKLLGIFSFFNSIDFPIKNRMEVKVHVGCAEEMATLILLDAKALQPGESGYVQIRLENPMVAAPGDRFLIRRHSPATSLGGGRILYLSNRNAKRFKDYVLDDLKIRREKLAQGQDALTTYEMSVWRHGFFTPKEMARAQGLPLEKIQSLIETLIQKDQVKDTGRGTYLHKERYNTLAAEVVQTLDDLHHQFPLRPDLDLNLLKNRLSMEGAALQSLIKRVEADGAIVQNGKKVRKAGFEIQLDGKQAEIADNTMDVINKAGLCPPDLKELKDAMNLDPSLVDEMVDYLSVTDQVRVISGFIFSSAMIRKLRDTVIQCGKEDGEVKIPRIKETFNTTRKFMIPLMEYLDQSGLTRREGDRRFLADGV